MKIKNELIELERQCREEVENAYGAFRKVVREKTEEVSNVVKQLNEDWSEFIGKRVKITCEDEITHNELEIECYFDGFKVETSYMYQQPKIRLNLYKIKKNGEKSLMHYHLQYYFQEIKNIEII